MGLGLNTDVRVGTGQAEPPKPQVAQPKDKPDSIFNAGKGTTVAAAPTKLADISDLCV